MKVAVEMKITVLDGEEAGQTFKELVVADTKSRYTELGIIEHLKLEWNYIRDTRRN